MSQLQKLSGQRLAARNSTLPVRQQANFVFKNLRNIKVSPEWANFSVWKTFLPIILPMIPKDYTSLPNGRVLTVNWFDMTWNAFHPPYNGFNRISGTAQAVSVLHILGLLRNIMTSLPSQVGTVNLGRQCEHSWHCMTTLCKISCISSFSKWNHCVKRCSSLWPLEISYVHSTRTRREFYSSHSNICLSSHAWCSVYTML